MLLMVIGNLGYATGILLEALIGQTPCRHGVSQYVITIFLLVFVTQLIIAWIASGRSVLLVSFFDYNMKSLTTNKTYDVYLRIVLLPTAMHQRALKSEQNRSCLKQVRVLSPQHLDRFVNHFM